MFRRKTKPNDQNNKSFEEIRAEWDKRDNQDSINLCEERIKKDQSVTEWSCKAATIIGDSTSKEECRKYTSTLIGSIFKCHKIKDNIRKESYTVKRDENEYGDGRIKTPTFTLTGFKNI